MTERGDDAGVYRLYPRLGLAAVRVLGARDAAASPFPRRAMKEKRYKCYLISPEHILTILQDWKHATFLSVPTFPTLPNDAEIEGVSYDHMRRMFTLHIWSSTFDIVPNGEIIPTVNEPLNAHMCWVKIQRGPTDDDIAAKDGEELKPDMISFLER